MNTKDKTIRGMMETILTEYPAARRGPFGGSEMGKYLRWDAVGILKAKGRIPEKQNTVQGSAGQGNWAAIPWIAIMDQNITHTAQEGVYIVYLFSEDGKRAYLTLIQAMTEVQEHFKKSRSAPEQMDELVRRIREKLDSRGFQTDNTGIHLADESASRASDKAKGYQRGTILYRAYRGDALPPEEELEADLETMMEVYREYAALPGCGNSLSFLEEDADGSPSEEPGTEAEPQRPDETEEKGPMSVFESITQVKEFIRSRGFTYPEGLVENFYLSLKSKPFVILAGVSGTGKTRLVRLFAEAIGATGENGRYRMVPVRPDWSDSSDLFGHVDLGGHFIPGTVLDFVKRAENDAGKPYILCLDEMNLARVEYYLSDILSVMETRDFDGEKITTDPILTEDFYGGDEEAREKYRTVRFPENLYLVGTVNMDETTFPFSRKVLDRANTIEFSFVNLVPAEEEAGFHSAPFTAENDFLKTDFLLLSQCLDGTEEERDAVFRCCEELQSINEILEKAGAQVGYRVRDEVVFYVLNNQRFGLLSESEAMDNEIMQKILPRIQGNGAAVKDVLCELFKRCAGQYDGISRDAYDLGSRMLEAVKKGVLPYPKSAAKIAFMMRRYEDDGFTSFWF